LMGSHDLPTVDVFVTCCKEDNDVVMDTARASCDQDYPQDRFRVIILDDGKSQELEQMAEEASHMWPNLIYMSREKIPGKPHHFKAGNLNFGLEQITLLPGGSAEFVGALDADMVSFFFLPQFSLLFPCKRRREMV
jgi:cellulose synthase/poly-beta-1,6-N-acetylglucosamine synthase-like glycosyltransferase